jgi:hypothetical protein
MAKKIFFILVAIVMIWVYFALPVLGLYANDGGAKHIQMKSFYLNRWQKLNIEYPGQEIGLDFSDLNPVRYFVVINDALYCSYLPLFTYLSSFFYPALGDKVIHFLPLLSFFLALIVFERILKLIMKEGLFYYVLLAAFFAGSPIVVYSITFWEHLPAILLVVSSLYFLTKYFKRNASSINVFMSSLLLGISIFFRTEMVILILSYLISICWILLRRKEKKRIIYAFAGLGLPITIYLVTNYAFYGNWLGLHGVYHQPQGFSLLRSALYLIGLFVSYCFVFLLNRNKEKELMSKFYQLILLFWLGVLFIKFGASPVPAIFFGFPLILALFFDGGRTAVDLFSHKPELEHLLFGAVITYISLSAIMLNRNPDITIRYMLVVVPFVLIFFGLRSKEIIKFKPLYILVGMLILWGFLVNCDQLKNSVLLTKQSNAERVEFLKNNTREKDVIIFQSNPLMEHCGPLFFERVYMVSKNRGGDIVETLSSLKQKGIDRCFYWTKNRDFSANFPEENDYALEEFVFSAKNFSRHYLIKIEL